MSWAQGYAPLFGQAWAANDKAAAQCQRQKGPAFIGPFLKLRGGVNLRTLGS